MDKSKDTYQIIIKPSGNRIEVETGLQDGVEAQALIVIRLGQVAEHSIDVIAAVARSHTRPNGLPRPVDGGVPPV